MKKLVLTVAITAFAVAAYAGGETCAAKAAAACKDQKATCSAQAKAACSAQAKADCTVQAKANGDKLACCATKTACSGTEVRQRVLQSPKGAELAKK